MTSLIGGQTGKISGIVLDKETQEPLIGVNVIIKELLLGASTDERGYYSILNVQPGVYSIEIAMMGYTKIIQENVEVTMNITTVIDAKLSPSIVGMQTIHVIAERPEIVRDISGSQLTIKSGKVRTLPIKDITEAIGLQAGIEDFVIRGGSSRQTAFMLDGFQMADERSNLPITTLSLNSVQEIQIQTGGFSVEYGNLRSGVVNIVTKEGARDHYSGDATIQYKAPQAKNYDRSIYGNESYYLRSYLDDDVAFVGTTNGGWSDSLQAQYPYFEGWNAVSLSTLADTDPSNDLSPNGAKQQFLWEHRRNGSITQPDYSMDLSINGPFPAFSKNMGNLRFSLSHYREKQMFVIPLSRDAYEQNTTQLKLTTSFKTSIKLTLMWQYGTEYSVSPYNWDLPTGTVLKSTNSIASLVSGGNNVVFMPGYFSPTTLTRAMFGIKMNHMLSSNSFYEVLFQQTNNKTNTFQLPERDFTKNIELFDGFYVNEAPYGYDSEEWMNLGRDTTKNSTSIFKIDFTRQLNQRNQIKTGLSIVNNDFRIASYTESDKATWTRDMHYQVTPFRFAAYFQDKLEFEGFIANIGLRGEYSNPQTSIYDLTDYDPFYTKGTGFEIEKEAPVLDSKPVFILSPRLGISHPLSDKAKLYFNYGHMNSEASSIYRFTLQREANGMVTNMGNPNLSLERTIAYELGYSQSIYDDYLINVAAYYKDVTNQPGWISYRSVDNTINYLKAENNNYADIRGFEMTLDKTRGKWIKGFVNYTYMIETSGYFGITQNYQDPAKQLEYIKSDPLTSKPAPQPFFRANLELLTPENFGPHVGDTYLLGSWNASFIYTYKTGSYFTYNPSNIPDLYNNVQWRDYTNVDMRVQKHFKYENYVLDLFVDVSNVLNSKYLSYSGFSDNRDYNSYMKSLKFDWEEGDDKGNDRVGDYEGNYINMPNISSMTFLNPRSLTSGIRFSF